MLHVPFTRKKLGVGVLQAAACLAQANRLNANEFSGLVEYLCQRSGFGTLTNAV